MELSARILWLGKLRNRVLFIFLLLLLEFFVVVVVCFVLLFGRSFFVGGSVAFVCVRLENLLCRCSHAPTTNHFNTSWIHVSDWMGIVCGCALWLPSAEAKCASSENNDDYDDDDDSEFIHTYAPHTLNAIYIWSFFFFLSSDDEKTVCSSFIYERFFVCTCFDFCNFLLFGATLTARSKVCDI